MNATAIIEGIKQLPPSEQLLVVAFVQSFSAQRVWSGEKLSEYEKRMVETNDPAEAQRLKEQIVAGFYGNGPSA